MARPATTASLASQQLHCTMTDLFGMFICCFSPCVSGDGVFSDRWCAVPQAVEWTSACLFSVSVVLPVNGRIGSCLIYVKLLPDSPSAWHAGPCTR